MPRRFLLSVLAGLVLILPSLVLPSGAAAADAPGCAPAATPVLSSPGVLPAGSPDLFTPEPEERLTPPKYGPCTMSFQCSSACGGQFISCSGQEVCRMGYGPRYPWCGQNIYVQCDNQAPIYCIGAIAP